MALLAGSIPLALPTKTMVSSFTAYQKLVLRGGVGVGRQTTQDIINFHNHNLLTLDSHDNDGGSLKLLVDVDRDEPFFVILISTPRLLRNMHLTRPLETDETFKVIHEGYPLTLIGQSDMNRRFHLRSDSITSSLSLLLPPPPFPTSASAALRRIEETFCNKGSSICRRAADAGVGINRDSEKERRARFNSFSTTSFSAGR